MQSFLPYDARFPVILPRDSPVTRLIVRSYHEENNQIIYCQCCRGDSGWWLDEKSSRNAQIIT